MFNMKFKKLFFPVTVVFVFLILMFCRRIPNLGVTPMPQMNSVDNVIIVSGQNATLIYNSATQKDGFLISFSNVGSLTCADVSIKISEAYGLVPINDNFSPSPINTSMPQYTCNQSEENITLFGAPPLNTANFRPWVDKFTINVGAITFKVTVDNKLTSTQQTLSRDSQEQMNLNSSFSGCGLNGTILQRVYDCSKMITNYGSMAIPTSSKTGSDSGTYYTKFVNGADPTTYWFVVSCPTGTGGPVPQQSCAYLTPVVDKEQPALDRHNIKLFTMSSMSNAYQNRLLFSGFMNNGKNGYTFEEANGYSVSGSSQSPQTYSTDSASNPGNGATTITPEITASVCITPGGNPLNNQGSMNSNDATLRDSISVTTGATVSWKMPSYPMLVILTGGTPTDNPPTGDFSSPTQYYCSEQNSQPRRPFCDVPVDDSDNKGFNAINIPGFFNTNLKDNDKKPSLPNNIWSSSSSNDSDGRGWTFFPYLFTVGAGYCSTWSTTDENTKIGARCVSTTWF